MFKRLLAFMDPFISYLQYAKHLMANINEGDKPELHVVMGNESCDLDSMISALALAYLRYQVNPNTIPIMNIHSHEFAIRTENCYILKKLGIDPSVLFFRDTVDLDEYHCKNLLKLSLVDHHELKDKDKHLSSSVVEIFDHRPVDPHFAWGENVTTVINEAGSCATLISNEIFLYCDSTVNVMSTSIATLLYSAITFDTIAYNISAGKTTPLDEMFAGKLAEQFSLYKDPKALFEELWNAHNDVSHLTPEQLLNKDLKLVRHLPISGLPMLVKEFFELPNASKAVVDFSTSRNSQVIILMGLRVVEDEVSRDLGIWCCSGGESIAKIIVKFLENTEELNLIRVAVNIPQVEYFQQGNVKLTRKFILPIVKRVLVSLG